MENEIGQLSPELSPRLTATHRFLFFPDKPLLRDENQPMGEFLELRSEA